MKSFRNNLDVFNQYSLAPRQQEVAELLLKNQTTQDIATILNINHRTVSHHIYRIYQKFSVRNASEFRAEFQKASVTTDGTSFLSSDFQGIIRLSDLEKKVLETIADNVLNGGGDGIDHRRMARSLMISKTAFTNAEASVVEKLQLEDARDIILAALLWRDLGKKLAWNNANFQRNELP